MLLVLIGVAVLIWLASTVELIGRVESGAAWTAILQLPGMLVRLLPLCVLIGVALAVARMEQRSERRALWLLGHGLARTGAVVALVGLLFGLGGLALQGGAISALERSVLSEVPVEEGWVWADSSAIRVSDGLVVSLVPETLPEAGSLRLGRIQQGEDIPEAWMSLHPTLAANQELMGSTSRLRQVELQGRLARALACSLLAFWAWLPSGTRGRSTLLEVLLVGLGWSLLELIMHGLARTQAIGVLTGAWIPLLLLGLLCGVRLQQGSQIPQSRYQT
jgi:lipopolysaccharide export LptBFGC system permease protein LptF